MAEEDGPATAVLGAIAAASLIRLGRKVKHPRTGLSQNHQRTTTPAPESVELQVKLQYVQILRALERGQRDRQVLDR